ncbi:hypothetical protein RFI_05671 [Reticulomyxa filosa]|uniref:Uncharacterized protein n=1 Tax=Reticulomyxa filosa TaxID=46433 RepID=X6NZY9_RETFI|nr:hypothetical protein RFI_05671 [Reticulomyxa filosa]|eukprot:ETO31448.1 hypothetical protein RFI_05671 [Reticulomyxa filosa]
MSYVSNQVLFFVQLIVFFICQKYVQYKFLTCNRPSIKQPTKHRQNPNQASHKKSNQTSTKAPTSHPTSGPASFPTVRAIPSDAVGMLKPKKNHRSKLAKYSKLYDHCHLSNLWLAGPDTMAFHFVMQKELDLGD